MIALLYGAMVVAQTGTCAKAYAMKRCGALTPGPFNSVCINLARSLICVFVSMAIWLFGSAGTTTLEGHAIIAVSGIGTAISLFVWILSTRYVPIILIESISTIGSLVLPLLLSPLLYGEGRVSFLQWVGSALICLSVFFFANKDTKKKEKSSLWGKVMLLVTCAASGTAAAIAKKYYTFYISNKGLGTIEYFTFMSFVTAFLFFVVSFCMGYFSEKKRLSLDCGAETKSVSLPYRRVWTFIVAASVGLYISELFGTYASQLPSAIYYPMSRGVNIVSLFLLDVVAYGDKITAKKLVGLVIILAGIVLVNL